MDALDDVDALSLLDDDAICLADAGLTLALADDPGADAAPARARFDGMLRALRERGAGLAAPAAQARLLALVIATEEGFRGDVEEYEAAENGDWLAMFRRRRALPVTLSMLYVALARRMGWQADVLNVPGHVLVRVGHEPAAVLIDPFDRGAPVGAAAVGDIVRRALGRHAQPTREHLQPMTARAVLVRLLNNGATRARRAGDVPRALTLTARMTRVAPAMTPLWWERARLEQLSGDRAGARRSLAAMRETTRDPQVMRRIDVAWEALTR